MNWTSGLSLNINLPTFAVDPISFQHPTVPKYTDVTKRQLRLSPQFHVHDGADGLPTPVSQQVSGSQADRRPSTWGIVPTNCRSKRKNMAD